MLPLDKGPGVYYIGEYAGGAAKNIIFYYYVVVNRHVVLYLYPIPDDGAGANVHILADGAFFADLRAAHNMTEMPYFRTLADFSAFINVTGFVDEIISIRFHQVTTPYSLVSN
jgi:hypothetical protein